MNYKLIIHGLMVIISVSAFVYSLIDNNALLLFISGLGIAVSVSLFISNFAVSLDSAQEGSK